MNKVPEGWTQVRLGKVCEINPCLKEKLLPDTEVSFIPMDAVSNQGRFNYLLVKKYEEVSKGFTSFSEDDILFAKITPCMENGKGVHAKGLKNHLGFGSTEFHILRATKDIDSRFIYQLVHGKYFRLEAESNMTGSAGQRRVPTDFIKNYQFCLPPPSEQEKIAEILSSVDRSIEATEKLIAKLTDVKKALMQKLFTKGIGHTKFKDSPLGRIPQEWEVKSLIELLDSIIDYRGKSIPKSNKGVLLITAKNIREGFLCFDDKEYIAEEDYDSWMSRGMPSPNDVLFTTEAPMGMVCMFPNQGKFAIGQRTVALRPNRSLNPIFLMYYLLSETGQQLLTLRTTGSTAQGIKASELKLIETLCPPLTEQIIIASVLSANDSKIEKAKSRLNKLQDMKKGLMQDLLTGKVRTLNTESWSSQL